MRAGNTFKPPNREMKIKMTNCKRETNQRIGESFLIWERIRRLLVLKSRWWLNTGIAWTNQITSPNCGYAYTLISVFGNGHVK